MRMRTGEGKDRLVSQKNNDNVSRMTPYDELKWES